ncbi:XRE family transcriptional regulator [Sesbania bispinosa]|nr:XRE family transcriptional regulator [Sesbania bispinosa]
MASWGETEEGCLRGAACTSMDHPSTNTPVATHTPERTVDPTLQNGPHTRIA